MSDLAIPSNALAARRERIAGVWRLADQVVLVPSGLSIPVDGTDQFHPFHAHAEHVYLAGLTTPGQILAYDPVEESYYITAAVIAAAAGDINLGAAADMLLGLRGETVPVEEEKQAARSLADVFGEDIRASIADAASGVV